MINRNYLATIFFCLLFLQNAFGQAFETTWTGNAMSTNWNTDDNWSNGVPDIDYFARFVTGRPAYPVLSQDQEIGGLIMEGGNYNITLGGKKLVVVGGSSIQGGGLSDGTISSANFEEVTNATFTRVTFLKTDAGTAHFGGNLVFNDSTSIEMGGTVPAGTSLFMGYQDGYDITFNGKVAFRNSSPDAAFFYIARDTGTITFKDTVEFINPQTNSVFALGDQGGTSVLDSFAFLDVSLFIAGNLNLRRVQQNGTQAINITSPATLTIRDCQLNGPLTATASTAINLIRGNTFNGQCNLTASNIDNVRSNVFNGPAKLQKITVGGPNTWDGGNTFNDTLIIINTSMASLATAFVLGDTFNTYCAFRRFSSGILNIGVGSGFTNVFRNDIDMISTTNAPNFGPGIALFEGDSTQYIKGIGSLDYPFDYITLRNDSDMVLQAPVLLGNTLTFEKGVIYSDSTNLFSFTANGSYLGSSDSTYIIGPAQKRNMANMSSFVFPVGDTSFFAPIAAENAADGPTFTAQYFYVNPDSSGYDRMALGDSIEHVSKAEYWILNKNSLGGSAFVTLYWAHRSGGVSDPNELLVARWDTLSNEWLSEGRGVVSGTTAAGTISSQQAVTQFSPFTLSSGIPLPANPLPISLLNFTARAQADRTVLIEWSTAQEQDNAYFEIERSMDGIRFETLATLPGAGNSYQLQQYKAIDPVPFVGNSYYRLKQTDWDGRYSYSPLASVRIDPSNDKINIYPNPAFEWLVAEWGQTDTPERLTLYNAAGQPCRVITDIQEGKALLNTASLPKGLYWLEIIQKGERTVQAIGVQ